MEPRRKTRRTRGQALAEMGLVILLFTTITLAIIDFGRMLMILNVITHATRDSARQAAVIPSSQFGVGNLSGAGFTAVKSRLQTQLETVLTSGDASALANSLVVSRVAGGAAGDMVQATVTGPVPFLFAFPGLWGGDVDVNRVATFRFEG